MKPVRTLWPWALLALAWLAFAAYVWLSAGRLPERVATHFGLNGEPNGWETHADYVRSTLVFGSVVPAFIVALFVAMRLGNGWGLNIPHKDYWLAPERRQETLAFVQRQGLCFAALLIAFFAGMHYFILAANAQAPANLPSSFAFRLGGAFLAATIIWVATFTGHFFRKPL
ncbi:MAG: DUF1648 domain-containing protein [Chthoniobacter sp.]